MVQLNYRKGFKVKSFKGNRHTNDESYYSAVYEDIIKYPASGIDTKSIKTDEDLKRLLGKDPRTAHDTLYNKLVKTEIHREIINQNLATQGKVKLKNNRIVSFKKIKVKGRATDVYETIFKNNSKQKRIKSVLTGQFVKAD